MHVTRLRPWPLRWRRMMRRVRWHVGDRCRVYEHLPAPSCREGAITARVGADVEYWATWLVLLDGDTEPVPMPEGFMHREAVPEWQAAASPRWVPSTFDITPGPSSTWYARP